MKSEWQEMSLYDLATWKNGLAFRDIDFAPVGKPVIKIAELKNGITSQTRYTEQSFDSSVAITNGDMLFSWSGNPETSIDVFWYRLADGWLNQHIFKVTEKGINRYFLYYLLKSLKQQFTAIAANKQTTGLGHVTVSDLRRMRVSIPSIPEQEAIVSVLKSLDERIDVNCAINHNLAA